MIIASRSSQLALWQAELVRSRLLEEYPSLSMDILPVVTRADRLLGQPLSDIGGKGLFTKELEVALLEGQADLAVHSLKDMPAKISDPFVLAAVLEREDPSDAMVSKDYSSLEELPPGARVGTSSIRRMTQLVHKFPLLKVVPLRGNINTRLDKLDSGVCDAIILASAGLKRLGLGDRISCNIDFSCMLPAPGQGAICVEILSSRPELKEKLSFLSDPVTEVSVAAERMVARLLGANCRVPLSAYCENLSLVDLGKCLHLRVRMARQDSSSSLLEASEICAGSTMDCAEHVGVKIVDKIKEQGGTCWS